MYQTKSYQDLNQYAKINHLSDMFGEFICVVSYKPYWELAEEKKEEAIKLFHNYLIEQGIKLDSKIIEEIEKQGLEHLANACRRYGYSVINETPLKAIVSKLEPYAGEKITIFKYNDFGFPIAIQTTLKELSIQPYAQYQNTLKIVHKPKRKRTYWANRFYESDQMIIVEGWHELETSSTHDTISSNQNLVVTQSKYACFDKQYMKDINETLNTSIIVKMNV